MRKIQSRKLTQTEKAYSAIKKAILQGDIEEGVFLSEPEIMARCGVGRTPYREACNRLHHEGLLQVVPRRGYLVPEISFHSVCDLFEMRLVLEDAIAQLAVVRATDEEIEALARLAAQTLPSGKSQGDFTQFIQANTNFHLQIAKITRNRQLVELLTRNLESTERLMYIELRSSSFRDRDFSTLHGKIVDAFKRRDAQAVRQALWEDITRAQTSTLSFTKTVRNEALPMTADVRAAQMPKRSLAGGQ